MVGNKAKRTLFVEGAAQHNAESRSDFRRALSKLFAHAGITMKPAVVPCGSRRAAYDAFCNGLAKSGAGDVVWLLVDAEAPVTTDDPWKHVAEREGDGWARPGRATADHLHLMVQTMEAWLIADPDAMARVFGKGFRREALPARPDLEKVPKADLYRCLEAATKDTKAGPYGKGQHSFKILAEVDPAKIERASPWAKRFFDALITSD